MITESQDISKKENCLKENFIIHITNPMLYDRLHTLSAEYSLSVDSFVNATLKRLIDDVDFVRRLRIGNTDTK